MEVGSGVVTTKISSTERSTLNFLESRFHIKNNVIIDTQ